MTATVDTHQSRFFFIHLPAHPNSEKKIPPSNPAQNDHLSDFKVVIYGLIQDDVYHQRFFLAEFITKKVTRTMHSRVHLSHMYICVIVEAFSTAAIQDDYRSWFLNTSFASQKK